MGGKRKHSKMLAVLSILLIASMLFGCGQKSAESSKTIYMSTKLDDRYGQLIEEALPDHRLIKQTHPATQAFLERGAGLVTIDVIAALLTRANDHYHWYPHSRATVVIAVDRKQVTESVRGWTDLLQSDRKVGMSDEFIEAGCILTSMAYGLNNEHPVVKGVVDRLAARYDQGKLSFNDFDAPILVLFDYQAVALNQSGYDLEIIVPQEGTYTFDRGVISKEKLDFPSNMEKRMIGKGICTTEGNCDIRYYPEEAQYLRAVYPADVESIHKELMNTREYLNRDIYGTHVFIAASPIEYTMSALISMTLFVFWIGSCQMRSMQKSVSFSLFIIGICMILWMGVRFIKWQVLTISLMNRYLWYSYYIFMLSMSNFFLFMSTSINDLSDRIVFPRWFKALLLYEMILLLLIFTNDIHQWVFSFDLTSDFWEKNYSYNWGYYLVYFSFFLSLFIGIVALSLRVWKSPKRVRILMPIVVLILMIIYSILYIKRVPWAFYGDLSLMTCLFTLSFGETAMRTGLIQLNTKYVTLFDNSSLSMSIVASDGEVAYSSNSGEEIPPDFMEQVLDTRDPLIIEMSEDILLHSDPITGGNVVWKEDISEIHELQKKVAESVKRIKRTNEILEKRSMIQAKQEAVHAKAMLHSQLNQEIGDKLSKLDSLANELKVIEQQGDHQRYERVLAQISLTAIYIKRRCNLLFYVEQKYMSADAIVTYISEILEFAKHVGIESAPILGLKDELETQSSILLYDFCFSILEFLMNNQVGEMMLHLYAEGENVCLRVIAEVEFSDYHLSEKIEAQVFQQNASLTHKYLGEAQSIQLEIPMLERGIWNA